MKVIRNTPDQLIAEQMPWFIAVMLGFGLLIFVGFGLLVSSQTLLGAFVMAGIGGGMCFAAICVFVERLQLILDAHAGKVTLRKRTILGHKEAVFPLEDLRGATGESTLSGGAGIDHDRVRRKMHRPSLVLRDGAGGKMLHPVTEIYDSSMDTAGLVRAINDWLTQLRGGTGPDDDPRELDSTARGA